MIDIIISVKSFRPLPAGSSQQVNIAPGWTKKGAKRISLGTLNALFDVHGARDDRTLAQSQTSDRISQ